MNQQFSDHEIMKALIASDGIITQAAAAVGCNRLTIHRRINESSEVAEIMETIKEKQREDMEKVGLSVAKDPSHPQFFQTHRYYNRVKFGITENQVDITSGGQKIEFVPASTVDEESLQ